MSAQAIDGSFAVGNWQIVSLPQDWEFVSQWGLRCNRQNTFPSNVSFAEETMLEGQSLEAYVQSQMVILRQHMPEARVDGPQVSSFPEASEVLKMVIRHKAEDGRSLVQGQIYVRSGNRVGVLTCTTAESEIRAVQPAFDLICKKARFRPPTHKPRIG